MTFETDKELLQHAVEELNKLRDTLDKKGRTVLAWHVENFKRTYFLDSNFVELEDGTYKFRKR